VCFNYSTFYVEKSKEQLMKYIMPKWLQLLVRKFPGIRKNIANFNSVQSADHCEFDGISFQFDHRFMDKKRFVAIAAGAIENDEVTVAQKFLNRDDIIVEFGSGLGLAAARVNNAIKPQQHFCFEANPLVIEYAERLFRLNDMLITVKNYALGNGKRLPFYALNDYLLSSFHKPERRTDYNQIDVPTIKCQDVIDTLHPTAIFCDIEGAELDYLDAENFGPTKTIVVELHPNIYGIEGIKQFYKKIEKHGFKWRLTKGDTHCFIK
jgi:FkbM family methyltransferase